MHRIDLKDFVGIVESMSSVTRRIGNIPDGTDAEYFFAARFDALLQPRYLFDEVPFFVVGYRIPAEILHSEEIASPTFAP